MIIQKCEQVFPDYNQLACEQKQLLQPPSKFYLERIPSLHWRKKRSSDHHDRQQSLLIFTVSNIQERGWTFPDYNRLAYERK